MTETKPVTSHKAGAAAIGAAVTTIATHYLGLEIGGAIGILATAALTWFVSNREKKT